MLILDKREQISLNRRHCNTYDPEETLCNSNELILSTSRVDSIVITAGIVPRRLGMCITHTQTGKT